MSDAEPTDKAMAAALARAYRVRVVVELVHDGWVRNLRGATMTETTPELPTAVATLAAHLARALLERVAAAPGDGGSS